MKITTKYYLVPIVALLMGVMTSEIALTQGRQGSFGGMWIASEPDGLTLNVEDDGQKVTATVYSAGFDHDIQGSHTNNTQANVVVTRKNISSNCVTRMYATWTLINPTQLRSQVRGTDGRCDLPTNFKELRLFNRS